MIDCIVVGGGPAGLTAAIYLARFHLAVTVFDAGDSRPSVRTYDPSWRADWVPSAPKTDV